MKWVRGVFTMLEKANELLKNSEVFILSTNDQNGFPNTAVVSRPVIRMSFHNLKFYINGDGQTVKNICINNKGSVCCYDKYNYESVLLKGVYAIEKVSDFRIVENELNEYQKILEYTNPVILSFETYT